MMADDGEGFVVEDEIAIDSRNVRTDVSFVWETELVMGEKLPFWSGLHVGEKAFLPRLEDVRCVGDEVYHSPLLPKPALPRIVSSLSIFSSTISHLHSEIGMM